MDFLNIKMNKNKKLKRYFGNERGAVLIEFGVILPLFFVMMLFLIICYDIINSQIELQVEAYSGMRRRTMSINTPGNDPSEQQDAQLVRCIKERKYVIPRGMQKLFRLPNRSTTVVNLKAEVCSYAGTMRGLGVSKWDTGCGDRFYSGLNKPLLADGCK